MRPYEERFLWRLDWNLLRTFIVVVEQGGVTRAAEFMNLSQPTISSALKRLEETTEKRLLDRRPGRFALTPAGETVYCESLMIFGSISRLPGLMAAAETVVTGHIAIAMTSHVVCSHFDEVLARFNIAYPEVTYSISITDSAEVLSRVRQNQASVGLCLMREDDPILDSRILFREFFGLFCGPPHRLFGRSDVGIEEVSGERSVSFQTESENGPLYLVRQLRERVNLQPEPHGISANLPEVRRMIINGMGIGALPVHVAQRDVDARLLWQVPPKENLPAVDIHFVVNPRRSMNPAETAFVRTIHEMIAQTSLEERTYN
ncbi:LysR family transcriptional regulator [Sinorhizobium meliloti]|nr:LysR family transcriptional regulator [Sinorhizobium meliloti]QQF06458.1 LysR family transcriptional regulator [Sinorhizobium meliloti]QQF06470.1 LysR family transcriptional regulator [Sinorhizobium meliloti]RVL37063.1 LysR family transcriptional regulator [Sinorhizobium meliloti]RVL57441.1 LysR family transcriptional regulator [Sinorhizobium meliloti]RVP46347.1 LysR family transcriptional regulator [Sinorhizobium meliloti]